MATGVSVQAHGVCGDGLMHLCVSMCVCAFFFMSQG